MYCLALDDLAGQSVGHERVLTGRTTAFLPEHESDRRRATEEEEEREGMGVGRNTTSKSMDSTAEPCKYEEETKNSAHFYPIPVSVCNLSEACHYIQSVCVCVRVSTTCVHFK